MEFLSNSYYLEVRSPIFWLGTITALSAMLTHAFATLGIPKQMQQSVVLVLYN
jgi:hypothetical protein